VFVLEAGDGVRSKRAKVCAKQQGARFSGLPYTLRSATCMYMCAQEPTSNVALAMLLDVFTHQCIVLQG
jgi:hypothetical protein